MKIVCRKIIAPTGEALGESSPWLKVGNEYVVLALEIVAASSISFYYQTEHYGQPSFGGLEGFEVIDDELPSSWVTSIEEINGIKIVRMLPASWDYKGFFDDIDDEESKAVQLFNEEAEKIYHEENLKG